jgi:hypothetical protein
MLIFENVFKCEFIGQPHSDFFKNSIVINHQISLPDLHNKKATLKDKRVAVYF